MLSGKKNVVVVQGVKYPLRREPATGVWSIRKRTREKTVYHNLGVIDISVAKEKAREFLEGQNARRQQFSSGKIPLRTITDAYLDMSKRVSEDVAKANVARLAVIVREAWGGTLDTIMADRLNEGTLWEEYAAARHGGRLDLNMRREENRGINSAIRMAVSIFHEGLHESYRRKGIVLDFDRIRNVRWLPIIQSRVREIEPKSLKAMAKALPALKAEDLMMWRAVMIARFAGLRSKEIRFARRDWLERDKESGLWGFRICDRPEQDFVHKTGANYFAPILSKDLERELLKVKDGRLVPFKGEANHFFKVKCNNWIRQFIPRPSKGMHRLRALYMDQLRGAMGSFIRADEAGVEAAKAAAGHTTSKTTKRSYLQRPMIRTT